MLLIAQSFLAPPQSGEPTDPPEEVRRIVVTTGTQTEHDKEDSPVQTDVVQRGDIERAGAENLEEALEGEPGVRINRDFSGSGISLLGLDPKYTVILVDGQRVTGRVNGQIDLRRIPIDQVEQIEIVRGGGSVLYGSDAVAGAVNIVTRQTPNDGKPVEADARVAYGSFNTLDTTGRVGAARKRWSASAYGGYRHTSGFDRDPSDLTTTGPAIQQWNVGSSAGLGRFGLFRIDGTVDYLQRDQAAISESTSGAVVDRRNLTETVQARLTPEVAGNDGRFRFTGSYTLFRDQFVQDQRGDDALDQDQETVDQIVQLRAQHDHRIGKHTLTIGADGQLEFLEAARIDPPQVDRQRVAIFVQDEWRPFTEPTISIVPGLRLDYDTFFDAWVTPRIAAMVRPVESFTLRFSYGRSYRAPDFKEMYLLFSNPGVGYMVRGNDDLRPEDAWGTTIDASFAPLEWLSLEALFFETRISDAIIADLVGEGGTDWLDLLGYVNVGNVETRGLEGRVQFTVRDWMLLGGGYQLTDARDVDNDRALQGRPRHSGTFDLDLRNPNPRWETGLHVRGQVQGPRPFYVDTDGDDVTERQDADPYLLLDLRVRQHLTKYVELFIGIDNVVDAGDASTNPLIPRAFYGGIAGRY